MKNKSELKRMKDDKRTMNFCKNWNLHNEFENI